MNIINTLPKAISISDKYILKFCNPTDGEIFETMKEYQDLIKGAELANDIKYLDIYKSSYDGFLQENQLFLENKRINYNIITSDNKQVGDIYLIDNGNNVFECIYFIIEEYRNRGIASNALSKLETELKNKLKSKDRGVILLKIKTSNLNSIRVAEKNGYQNEGKDRVFKSFIFTKQLYESNQH